MNLCPDKSPGTSQETESTTSKNSRTTKISGEDKWCNNSLLEVPHTLDVGYQPIQENNGKPAVLRTVKSEGAESIHAMLLRPRTTKCPPPTKGEDGKSVKSSSRKSNSGSKSKSTRHPPPSKGEEEKGVKSSSRKSNSGSKSKSTRHPPSTKDGDRKSRNSGSSKSGSTLRTQLSNYTSSSRRTILSAKQVVKLHENQKENHINSVILEMERTVSQIDNERILLSENLLKEERRIRKEQERKKRDDARQMEEYEQRLRDIAEKLEEENRLLETRKQINLKEIKDRSQREQQEFEANYKETLIRLGVDTATSEIHTRKMSETSYAAIHTTKPREPPISSTSHNEILPHEHGKATFSPLVIGNGNSLANDNEASVSVGVHESLGVSELINVGAVYNTPVKPIENSDDTRHKAVGIVDQVNSNSRYGNINQPSVQVVPYVVAQSSLPASEPPVFSGSPCQFHNFMDLFETIICSKTQDPKQRFVYLLQYTSGVPQELVRGCQRRRSENCYQDAVDLLREHYGQKFQVGQAWLNSISNGPQIRVTDREGLTKFSAELMSCANALSEIDYNSVSITDIEIIASRMPPAWRSGWLRVIDDVVYEQNSDVKVGHLEDYVRKQTREITNVYGTENSFVTTMDKPLKSVFATTVSNKPNVSQEGEISPCLTCGENYYLNKCQLFRAMSYDERYDFVTKNKLCLSCLKPGHWAKRCLRKNPCCVTGCTKMHTTLLHAQMDTTSSNSNSSGKIDQNEEPQEQCPEASDTSIKSENKFSAFVDAPPHKQNNVGVNDNGISINDVPIQGSDEENNDLTVSAVVSVDLEINEQTDVSVLCNNSKVSTKNVMYSCLMGAVKSTNGCNVSIKPNVEMPSTNRNRDIDNANSMNQEPCVQLSEETNLAINKGPSMPDNSVGVLQGSALTDMTNNSKCKDKTELAYKSMCDFKTKNMSMLLSEPIGVSEKVKTQFKSNLQSGHQFKFERVDAKPSETKQCKMSSHSSNANIFCKSEWNSRWQIRYLADCYWKCWIKEFVPILETNKNIIELNEELPRNEFVFGTDDIARHENDYSRSR